ncbi:MAG: class I SAM-dependent methyltransferase [Acidobacteria bacterium]|nr:class I SAM-dependent methyltransferase [Acidobacteriota bacterium]
MNADPLAPVYRWVEYAAFGRLLETCRFFFLPELRQARRALILGEGDGRFLARFLACNPTATVDVVEQSPKMIALARARIRPADTARVAFHRRIPAQTYDLIVTHFFLDCLSAAEAQEIIAEAAAASAPGATWIASEFHIPAHGIARWHAQLWITTMYAFFRWTTGLQTRSIPPYEEMLAEQGFHRRRQQHWRWGLVKAELYRKDLTSTSRPASGAATPAPPRP